jgi:hypothetical protein
VKFYSTVFRPVLIIFGIVSILSSCASLPKQDPNQEEWQDLFNGKDLSDWDIKIRGHKLNENFKNTFVVRDGVLAVDYKEYDKYNETFGHLFHKESFSYYRLHTEYRFIGEQANEGPGWALRNNGLMLHSQSAASMGLDQDFPISIEVQLLGGTGSGARSTANLCTPGTNVVMKGGLFEPHCVNSTSKTYHGDRWVTVDVIVLGDSLVTHIVEGETVLQYTHPQIGGGNVGGYDTNQKKDGKALTQGYIAIQGESHPTEFRKIQVLNLEGCMDKKAKNYKSYFVSHNQSDCKY